MPSACYQRAGVGSTSTARGMVPEGSLDSIQSDPTRCGGRNVWGNGLGGTLPAELGKLTDLEELCAPLLSAATAGRVLTHCGGAQRM